MTHDTPNIPESALDAVIKLEPEDIRAIRIHEGMNQHQFSEKLGVSREVVNKMESGKIKISAKTTLWLINHYGGQLHELINRGNEMAEKGHVYKAGVPIFDIPVSSSLIAAMDEKPGPEPAFFLKGHNFADCSFGAKSKIDHAMSEIRNGDYLVFRKVSDYHYIDYSGIYFVTGRNGIELCRYIHPHPEDEQMLLLKTDRKEIPASPIPKSYIIHLYKVMGIIRSF